ncbi:hypothetical protein HHK36_024805 [Tetracentron sinense]|uniref:Protein kinase domain-containing protein n=1 Tax=Tetracentron sinense TaxID=13715 RepID=A0A834YLS0_TETSI|nr:hypothetical protein HHK36_024805 [Tetracentron sinense]
MGLLVWVLSAVAAAATLLSTCSFALTQDGKTLLEIKGSLNDSRSLLRNWKASDDTPCHWTGITCYLHDQRVRSINLPYMQLGGIISPSIGMLSRLQRLALHQNSLHGFIPNEITKCTELRALYLRANYLQGGIPSELVNLSHLTILDLSSNSLKGSIPSSIGRLTRLRFLNLSTNFFSGEIPNVVVLGTFGNKSSVWPTSSEAMSKVSGIPCSATTCRQRRSSRQVVDFTIQHHNWIRNVPTKRFSHYLNGVLIGAMSTMGLALAVLLIFLWICLLSKKERVAKKYTEVKKQVDPKANTKLITFHGDLPYPSCEIIEKLESLDEEDVVGSGGFGTVYKMVMNDCGTFAVKRIDRSREGCDQIFERELEILGSIKHINLVNLRGYCRLPISKLLIYDYLALGSLDHFLHVDEDAHVTTVVAGTFGYLAPEYLQSGRATEKSDVYSFGVLLLELVTGKRPTDPSFVKRGLNVVGWMNTLLRENKLVDVVDKRCTDADAETVEMVLDIASRCTDANPDDRPSMNRVLQMLEEEVMSPCPSVFYESQSDYN